VKKVISPREKTNDFGDVRFKKEFPANVFRYN
jgi:hypothetical protein